MSIYSQKYRGWFYCGLGIAVLHTLALIIFKNSAAPILDWLMMPLGWLLEQGIEPLIVRLPNHLYYHPAVSWIYIVAGVANSFLWGLAITGILFYAAKKMKWEQNAKAD